MIVLPGIDLIVLLDMGPSPNLMGRKEEGIHLAAAPHHRCIHRRSRVMDFPDASPVAKISFHRYPDWVMLDPHTRLNYPQPTLGRDLPQEDFDATNAQHDTSMGEPVDVCFRVVPPPGASRLYVRWTPRRRSAGPSSSVMAAARWGEDRWDGLYGREPLVLAAHGRSILLQFNIENEKTRSDFLVYTVHSSEPPSLFRLPTCNHKLTHAGLRSGGLDHMIALNNIGLMCNAVTEEFVVADLLVLPKYNGVSHSNEDTPVVAGLCVFRSCSHGGDWKATRPRICHEEGQGKDLIWWHTDAVIPCGASLCYVDYFRGILFLDVLSECPRLLYIRLPLKVHTGDPHDRETGLRGCPASFRSVCVTAGGTIKYVEVVTATMFFSGRQSAAASSFTIKVWRLRADEMIWEKEATMKDNELWSLEGYGNLLRVSPTFPLVSMNEPNCILFVLSNRRFGDENGTWIIVVDMVKRTLRSSTRFNKVHRNCIENDGDMASASLSTNRAFIPCELSKYLRVPACLEPEGRGGTWDRSLCFIVYSSHDGWLDGCRVINIFWLCYLLTVGFTYQVVGLLLCTRSME